MFAPICSARRRSPNGRSPRRAPRSRFWPGSSPMRKAIAIVPAPRSPESEETLRAAFEEEKLQAEQKLEAAFKDREAQLSGEWTVLALRHVEPHRSGSRRRRWSPRTSARSLLGQKAESERALAAVRAEAEALATRLAEAERDRDRARAEVARNEEVVLAAFEEQTAAGRAVREARSRAQGSVERRLGGLARRPVRPHQQSGGGGCGGGESAHGSPRREGPGRAESRLAVGPGS